MSAHELGSRGPYGRWTCRCGEQFEGDTAQDAFGRHIANPPAGMAIGKAIRLVAQHVLASAARDYSDGWEHYPKIGEHDWNRIVDRLDDIAPFPNPDEYREAYALLETRTDNA